MTRPATALAAPMLAGVALNLALVGLAVARYPAIFGAERVPFVLVDVAILLGYGAAAAAMASIAGEGTVRALTSATRVGLVAGVLQGLEIVREDLVAAEQTTALLTGLVGLLAMFALFGLAGVLAGAGRPGGGALAGAWCAMVAMLALWLIAWGLDYAFADRLARIWPTDYDYTHGNTLGDLSAYTLWNTLSAALIDNTDRSRLSAERQLRDRAMVLSYEVLAAQAAIINSKACGALTPCGSPASFGSDSPHGFRLLTETTM